jgi:hypothetical protein
LLFNLCSEKTRKILKVKDVAVITLILKFFGGLLLSFLSGRLIGYLTGLDRYFGNDEIPNTTRLFSKASAKERNQKFSNYRVKLNSGRFLEVFCSLE